MPSIRPSLALVAFLLFGSVVCAQETYDFRLRPKKGTTATADLVASMTLEATIEGLGAMKTTTATNKRYSVKVTDVDEEGGSATFEVKVERVWGKLNTPTAGEIPFDSDAGDEDPRLSRIPQVKEMLSTFTRMAGKTVHAKVAPTGAITVMDAENKTLAANEVRSALGLRPKKPLAVGETSQLSSSDFQAEGTPLTGKGSMTLKEVAEDSGTFELEATFSVDPEQARKYPMYEAIEISSQKTSGTCRLMRADGLPIESRMESELSLAGGMKMKIQMSETLAWKR